MKIRLILFSTAVAAAVTGGAARSQQTQAVSRLVTVYTGLPSDTRAVSRLATLYTGLPNSTKAVSRVVTKYSTANPMSTRGTSRLVTAWLGLSVQNAATALRIAAGLHTATPREKEVFDLITAGTPANVVDVIDACRIAIYAMNPAWLP